MNTHGKVQRTADVTVSVMVSNATIVQCTIFH